MKKRYKTLLSSEERVSSKTEKSLSTAQNPFNRVHGPDLLIKDIHKRHLSSL